MYTNTYVYTCKHKRNNKKTQIKSSMIRENKYFQTLLNGRHQTYIRGSLNKFQDFFSGVNFYWEYTHETLVSFEVISSSCNALVVSFQQLREGSKEVLLWERVNDLRHSLFHLLNSLITTASELREHAKVTGSKVCTIETVRNLLDAHFGQIVWPLPMESLLELP